MRLEFDELEVEGLSKPEAGPALPVVGVSDMLWEIRLRAHDAYYQEYHLAWIPKYRFHGGLPTFMLP